MFQEAEWIWIDEAETENQYGEFSDTFRWESGKVVLHISVFGDYTVFVNGVFAECNQFGDYAHYKIYDTIDITPYVKSGENRICVLAWYIGKSSQRYCLPHPGLLFEVQNEEKVLCASSEKTPSRLSLAYQSGEMQKITRQLGYSFFYDATKEDMWLSKPQEGFRSSSLVAGAQKVHPRQTEKLVLQPMKCGSVSEESAYYAVDLGEEVTGLVSFSFESGKEQTVRISYGELLENGRVKRLIEDRDFSVTYRAKEGENEYTNYMLRFACRYLEIECERPIDIKTIGIIPQVYPVKEKPAVLKREEDQRIYDACLNTLRLCMMEHYVDCPWREQCLYAFDSKNQILAGYDAFENGNSRYARANLLLMSKDRRTDGILSICFPSGENFTIPSFSLYYIIAVAEYMMHTKDDSLGEEVFTKITEILSSYKANMDNGLVCIFQGENHWNFYDWSEYCVGNFRVDGGKKPDFIINALTVLALQAYDIICKRLKKENIFAPMETEIKTQSKKRFYDSGRGVYVISEFGEKPTELANSLAILSGIATDEEAKKIAGLLADDRLLACSLSMKCMKYDAMLSVDAAYQANILDEIRKTYLPMLSLGNTVWETALGAEDFDNAGSLCHGWSAIPIHYYHLFGEVE